MCVGNVAPGPLATDLGVILDGGEVLEELESFARELSVRGRRHGLSAMDAEKSLPHGADTLCGGTSICVRKRRA